MFELNPLTIIRDFKNYSWVIILLAVILIIPYYIFYGPFKAYRIDKIQKQSEKENNEQRVENNQQAENVEDQWKKDSNDIDEERKK